MILLNRYIGSWLDDRREYRSEEKLREAFDPMSSDIYKAIHRPEIAELFKEAVEGNSYCYAVPVEKTIKQVIPNKYYRYEVIPPTNSTTDYSEIVYGKGYQILEHDGMRNIFTKDRGKGKVIIYEYDSIKTMMYDLSEECYLTDHTTFMYGDDHSPKRVVWLDSERDLFYVKYDLDTFEEIYEPIEEDIG